MLITCELSLYPLQKEYESIIIDCIKFLKQDDNLSVFTHAMSTYIKGESADVFKRVADLYELEFMKKSTQSLVIKVINRNLPVEEGYLAF